MEKKEEKKKLSYDELENVANQLSEQSRSLYKKLQEANLTNIFKRLDYLFKVIEFKESFDPDFINMCIDEIEGVLTIPEKGDTSDSKED